MYVCANSREKSGNDSAVNDLQSVVVQLRVEAQRSSQTIGDLQQGLQKSNLRLAEVEVAVQDSKQHLHAVEAALHKSNQKSRSLEVALEEALRKFKTNVGDALRHVGGHGDNGYVSALQTPRLGLDVLSESDIHTPRFQPHSARAEQRWNEGSAAKALAVDGSSREDSRFSPGSTAPTTKSQLQAPSLQNSDFVFSRPWQERVQSLELLVSNLWQFHVATMWVPAPPTSPTSPRNDSREVAMSYSSTDLMKQVASTRASTELISRVDNVEHGLLLLKAELERRTGSPVTMDTYSLNSPGVAGLQTSWQQSYEARLQGLAGQRNDDLVPGEMTNV